MKIDLNAIENSVLTRKALPASLRPTLLEQTKSDWSKHPRFDGKAAFFMNIHRNLINGNASMTQALEDMLDMSESDLPIVIQQSRLLPAGKNLISFAHGHHEIEDHGYFPQFALLYPELDRALALLDGDHKVLDEALHGAEEALDLLGAGDPTRDGISTLYKHSKALELILDRHINDEEEIIIPIFLRHG